MPRKEAEFHSGIPTPFLLWPGQVLAPHSASAATDRGFRQPVVLPTRAFIHFPKYFLSTYYIPDRSRAGNATVKEIDKGPAQQMTRAYSADRGAEIYTVSLDQKLGLGLPGASRRLI